MTNRVVKVTLRGDVSHLVAAVETGAKSVQKAARDIDGTAKRQRQSMDALATSAGQVGLAAGIGLGLVSKAAMDWETAWAGVTKTIDGTPEQLAEIEDGLRNLAKTLPATHGEIAGVAEAAGQLGVAREDIVSFTETMVALGETTNLSAEEAATSIAQFANIMGTAPDEVDNLGAALVALGNDGASTEATIIQMAQRIAGAGAIIGASESDVLAIANALASVGIEVEAGGSSVSRILIDISKAVATNSADLVKWAQVSGMSVEQFSETWKTSPAEGFNAFTKGLAEVNAAGGDVFTTLDELGQSDVRVTQALLGMATSGDLLTESLKLGADAWQENAALRDEFAKRLDTTGAQAQVAINQIKDAAIEFGDAALPVIAGVAGVVGDLADALGSLPDPLQDVATGALGIVAVTGGAAWFGSKVFGGINKTNDALEGLGSSIRITKGHLSGLATYGTAAALGIGAILDEVSRFDSWSRSSDAAKAQVKTYEDLADTLQNSNVGKYAKDLQINVGRLAEELLKSGTSSEYVQKTLRALADEGHGVDAFFKDIAGEALPGYTSGASKAYDAGKDLNAIIANSGEVLGSAAEKTVVLADGTKMVGNAAEITATQVQESEEELQKLRDAATDTAQEFFGLGGAVDDTEVSLDGWIQTLRDQAKALEDFTANAKRAADKGLRQGLINALEEAGPAGALRMQQLANATKSEIAEANRAWKRGQKAIAAYVAFKVPTKDVTVNTTPAIRDLQTLKQFMASISSATVPTPRANQGLSGLLGTGTNNDGSVDRDGNPRTGKGKAGGGPIDGPGSKTSDSVLIRASAGEFMQRAAAVDYYGLSFMDDVNNLRFPKYAGGGPIGGGGGLGNYISTNLDLKMPRTLKQWEQAVAKNTKVIDKETEHRDDLVSSMDSLKSTVTDFFRPDIFESTRPDNWAYMSEGARNQSLTQSPIKALEKSIREGTEYENLLKTLSTNKLDGAAFEELAASGDLERVRAFAGQTAGQLGAYESLFNKNQTVSASVGNYAGNVVYSKQIAESNRELKIANGYHAQLNNKVDQLEKAVRAGADKIARGADRSRNRTATSIRLGRP